jgi:membrane fusion protein (multidrug efflux system)
VEGQAAPERNSGAPEETPRNRVRRRRIALPIIAVVVILGLVFGLRWVAYSRVHIRTDDAQVESKIYQVSTRVPGHVRGVSVSENDRVGAGQVLAEIDPTDYQVAVQQAQAALAQAEHAARAAESAVSVTEQTGGAAISEAGAAVRAAEAQQSVAERQAAAAASGVDAAKAAARAASTAVEVARRQVTAAQATLRSTQADAKAKTDNANRLETLASQGAVSAQDAETAHATAVSAQSAVETAQANLSSAEAAVGQAQDRLHQANAAVAQVTQAAAAARAGVQQATAAVAQAKAAEQSSLSNPTQVKAKQAEAQAAAAQAKQAQSRLDQAKLNLSYTRIMAPIDGVVAQKNVREGQYVQPGQPLFAVVPARAEYIDANYKETQLEKIKVGDPVTFTVDAYPGLTFHGTVSSISPGTGSVFSLLPPENATGNFTKVVQRVPVRVRVDWGRSPDRALRQGMSVVVTVNVRR